MFGTSGPEYGPGGLEIPGSRKNLNAELYSQVDGTLVKFGTGKQYNHANMYDSRDFLRHRDGPFGQMPQEQILRGVDTTKFHTGFQRRQFTDIQPDLERHEREAFKADRSAAHALARRARLEAIDKRGGINPITGLPHAAGGGGARGKQDWLLDGRPSIKHVPEGPSAELQRIGHIQLRDSLSRFFLPHYSGPNHDRRQELMVTEGLKQSKSSSILGVGSADLLSYGVEDQFSKSTYEPNRPCLAEGLVEKTSGGRFTPSKTGIWDAKSEPYGSLMSKLSITRSTAHLPRTNQGGGHGGQGQGHGHALQPVQTQARGFVAPVTSRGREMDDYRTEVSKLR